MQLLKGETTLLWEREQTNQEEIDIMCVSYNYLLH